MIRMCLAGPPIETRARMGIKDALQSNAALLCVVIIVQFGLFETGLRLKGGTEATPEFQRLFTSDPRLSYRLRPGATARFKTADFDTQIEINAIGVRDREVGPKRAGERRIVVLGDSLVMAVQVPLDDTFPARLERLLNDGAAPPVSYRVVNSGVQGYGPVEEYLFHRYVTSLVDPDLVILALYVGNDALEAAGSEARLGPVQRDAQSPRPGPGDLFAQWRRRVVRRSMVLQVARLRVTSILYRFGWGHEIDPPLRAYLPESSPDITKGLGVTRDAVARLASLASSQRAHLVVLLLPARFQVDDGDFQRLRDSVAQSGKTLERDLATQRFKRALEGLDVPVLDALPPLRAAARHADVFMQSTAHLTPFGHETLAKVLERYLRDTGFPDGHER